MAEALDDNDKLVLRDDVADQKGGNDEHAISGDDKNVHGSGVNKTTTSPKKTAN